MPLVALEPKKSIPLSACKDRNPIASTVITNPSAEEGKFVVSYNDMPLSVQYTLEPKHSITMCSAAGEITNDGTVTLEVSTPGL